MDCINQIVVQVLRKARCKVEGDAVFSRLREFGSEEGAAFSRELGIPSSVSLQDIEDAYKRCLSFWTRRSSNEADLIVKQLLKKSASLMDVDRQISTLEAKVGQKISGHGVLTKEILTEAHTKCHLYWARISPANIQIIVASIKKSASDWEAASKKFDWLWKKGEWTQDGKEMRLGDRIFTAEDLDQAERQCRRGFNLPAEPEVRRARSALPAASELPRPSSAAAPREPAAPATAAAPAEEVPNVEPLPGLIGPSTITIRARNGAVASTDGALPLPAPEAPKAPAANNTDFLVDHIMAKCSNEESARKFFAWLRREAETGKRVKGRILLPAEVDQAQRKCKEAWMARQRANSSSSSSDSSSSDEEDKTKDGPSESAGNVEFLVEKVMEKAKSMKRAEKMFDKLHSTVGRNQFGRVFNEAEITEAFMTVSGKFDEAKVAKKKDKKEKRVRKQAEDEDMDLDVRPQLRPELSKEDLVANKNKSNVDVIKTYALRHFTDMAEVEKIMEELRGTVGSESFLGRSFTEDDITEAFFSLNEFFESQEQGGVDEEFQEDDYDDNDDMALDESDGGSSSSYDPGRRKRSKKAKGAKGGRKDKLKRAKSSKLMDDELEGALFASDSDSLDAEEQVDVEDESMAAEMMADFGGPGDEKEEEEEADRFDDGYPVQDWQDTMPELAPGAEGFNRRATLVMQKARVGQTKLHVTFDANSACPPLQPHQESVGFLLHPKSPISKLLVDHPTGSGKTREMIKTLDNYFFDSRPKVPIFPKDPVCRNFYAELLRWPSRYRDYFCCERPADAAILCSEVTNAAQLRKEGSKPNWKEFRFHMWDLSNFREDEVRRLGYSIREVLEMKGMFYMGRIRQSCRAVFRKRHPGEFMPTAPLRAINYTSAGGAFSALTKSGRPLSCLMKIGFEMGGGNVYSNKIVLMDEAHNLVRTQSQYGEQLQHLRDLLKGAKNMVLAGYTGTPILNEPTEGRQLLDIIKGEGAPDGDEGFLSSFPMRPQPLFPLSMPRGLPDGVLTLARRRQLVRKVEMVGETLKMYDVKRRLQLPPRRLRAYCNVSTFHATFHEGKRGSKIKVLTFPEEHCPKLLAIAHEVASSPEKAIIMTGRLSGHVVMLELMKFIAQKADPPFDVATMDELAEFNHSSNLRGEVYRVLVADAAQCSEGVSFLAVRRTFLSDVPTTPSMFIQQCGRSIRMYGHRGLPEEEQTVTTMLYVSTFPRWLRGSSLACWALRAQKKHNSGREVERRGRMLAARLHKAGIKTLEVLKARIDKHGEAKRTSVQGADESHGGAASKAPLTSEDVVNFLELNGLAEEAKLLRNADKNKKEKEKALEEAKASLARGTSAASLGRLGSADSLGADSGSGIGRSGTLETIDLEESLAEALEDVLGEESQPGGKDDFAAALETVLDGEGVQPGIAISDVAATEVTSVVSSPALPDALVPSSGAGHPRGGAEVAGAAEEMSAEQAVTKALEVVKRICASIAKTPAAAPTQASSTGDLENDVGMPGEPPWKAQLEKGLEQLRHTEPVGAALRAAVHPAFEAASDDLRELGPDQVKSLREELTKLEKVSTIRKALAVVKEVRSMIESSAALALQAADQARLEAMLADASRTITPNVKLQEQDSGTPAIAASALPPQVASMPAEEQTSATPAPTASGLPAEEPSSAEDLLASAPVPAQEVGAGQAAAQPSSHSAALEPSGQTAVVPVPVAAETLACNGTGREIVPAADEQPPQVKASSLTQQQHREQEKAWRKRLVRDLEDLKGSEYIRPTLKIAELKVVSRALQEDSQDALDELTAESIKRFHDELARMQDETEKGGVKPRALVRAMQQLYLAESTRDASLSLGTETADEEALRQLAERTQEFAPALECMRSLAVDREIFAHLADAVEEADEEHASEEEASDFEHELERLRRDNDGLLLPEGWRVEFVQRGKRQMREFVDQDGIRYIGAKQARAAIAALEAAKAADRAEEERIAAENAACIAAAQSSAMEGTQPVKRMRLRSKASEASMKTQFEKSFGQGGLEAAFEEALGDMLGDATETSTPATASTGAVASSIGAAAEPLCKELAKPRPGEPQPGDRFTLKGLVAKKELNGQPVSLLSFSKQTGRWECQLGDGSKVNVKPDNFGVFVEKAAGSTKRQAAKRPAPSPTPGAHAAKAPVKGRGRGSSKVAAAARGASAGRGAGGGRAAAAGRGPAGRGAAGRGAAVGRGSRGRGRSGRVVAAADGNDSD